MSAYKLLYESIIKLDEIPIQWIPKIELYYPDIPQYPIQYIHFISGNKHVYGTPVAVSYSIKKGTRICSAEFTVLSNIDLDQNKTIKNAFTNELEERIGLSGKFGLEEIIKSCNGHKEYENFFRNFWDLISNSYGSYIPYGAFYDRVFSIIRFVAAWQPKTGRQSEMRMLYNFMSGVGNPVTLPEKWSHLEFYLIPTYEEIRGEQFKDFNDFGELYTAMKKIYNIEFTEKKNINGREFRSMKKSWPISGFREISSDLVAKKNITITDKKWLDWLVDAFNRHSWRAAFFTWNIMNIKTNDYTNWSKDDFIKFYETRAGVGSSEKVLGCFLQQGFRNEEVIPIDIWVESFANFVLGIEERKDFFNTFSKLGKLERIIWLASQSNKTNAKPFFYTQWCTRYGTTGNANLREQNPLSCYECKLCKYCVGHDKIKDKKVFVSDKDPDNEINTDFFVKINSDNVPKKVYKKSKGNWILIDEFSGYILHTQKTTLKEKIVTVEKFIQSLPDIHWE